MCSGSGRVIDPQWGHRHEDGKLRAPVHLQGVWFQMALRAPLCVVPMFARSGAIAESIMASCLHMVWLSGWGAACRILNFKSLCCPSLW